NSGAIRSDQPRLRIFQRGRDTHHVERGNSFGDADDQRQSRVGSFQNGVGGKWWWDKNDGSIRLGRANRLGHGVEYGHVEMLRSAFAWCDACDDLRAVLQHLLGMKAAFAAGEALDDNARALINKNTHRPPPASFTTFSAPSFMLSATVKLKPELRRISFPCSTLVPSMRTTTGIFSFNSFAAFTTPLASTSQRKMPPKMLTNTARTLGSLSRMRNAFFTWSSEAPPPTSRKFAGLPPLSLMMSMVAMARPAPFTMQPTVPSSLM